MFMLIFLSRTIFIFFGRWTRSKIYLQLCQIIWGLVRVKVTSPVPFNSPPGSMKKRKMSLGKRLVSPNDPNKHQLTFNFQGNVLSSRMHINCISESKKMVFDQFLPPWRCCMLFKSKCHKFLQRKRLKQLRKNEIYTVYL